jgi:hypothetical protein
MTVVDAHCLNIDISSLGFFINSEDFLSAYKSYTPEYPYSPAKCFLACRSLELALKAFIASEGESSKSMKKECRHSLVKALSRAKDKGLLTLASISDADELEIAFANDWYDSKRFEYFQSRNISDVANRRTPDHRHLAAITDMILESIRHLCLDDARRNQCHS